MQYDESTQHQTNPAQFASTERWSNWASDMFPMIPFQCCQHVPQWITSVKWHLTDIILVIPFQLKLQKI